MNPLNLNDKLPEKFYIRDVCTVARALLGKIIVRQNNSNILAGRIVEVEAYRGDIDQASHSYSGITKRNEVMFRKGGSLYVYFTYGMHFCCNVVTGKQNEGNAVLIRAVEPITGIEIMGINRFGRKELTMKDIISLTNGPAKLTKAFGIGREENGTSLLGSDIFIINAPAVSSKKISVSKRIGIKKSVDLLWRFYIIDNPFVSKK